ncbi:heparinase II/III family protein [Spirosoma sp. KUDC1026]|uniref:heparinase II/III family protein n=1 Tax=Spirosoma sp. KUDC1026 TaxID=2745947 RepID=UPI00210573FE|nr:heparinase II/III family protein [Spirosoma sp. KUDC1026]
MSWQAGNMTFLNQLVCFQRGKALAIDWEYAANGKLWTYQLNYFDFLNQPDMSQETGLILMLNFVRQTPALRTALEAYPTSLRIMNWIQFLSRFQYSSALIDRHLFAQVKLLNHRLEHHLAGNHLLENGFALLAGAMYFRQRNWLQKATSLIRSELQSQLLADGGHEERSPVYHQVLLDRLLDSILIVRSTNWRADWSFQQLLIQKAWQMLSWLESMTFANGDIPMVNDAAWGAAPTTRELRQKATQLLPEVTTVPRPSVVNLASTGYRAFLLPRYKLVVDVGDIGPDHQPGHAHADTFSFVLYAGQQPILVDSGTSTYQPGARRNWERSTAAHNTVEVAGQNSSEVWSVFRVGRRARVQILEHTNSLLRARHNGYRHLKINHERQWIALPNSIQIIDFVDNQRKNVTLKAIARYYIHPDVAVTRVSDGVIAGPWRIQGQADEPLSMRLTTYELAEGFNRLRSGLCLEITFSTKLETKLTLIA